MTTNTPRVCTTTTTTTTLLLRLLQRLQVDGANRFVTGTGTTETEAGSGDSGLGAGGGTAGGAEEEAEVAASEFCLYVSDLAGRFLPVLVRRSCPALATWCAKCIPSPSHLVRKVHTQP